MRHRLEISTVVRLGDRAGCRLVVVHGVAAQESGSARFAFAVGRNVGNSVQRHRLTRRLRHVVMVDVEEWDRLNMDFVVRALPRRHGQQRRTAAANEVSAGWRGVTWARSELVPQVGSMTADGRPSPTAVARSSRNCLAVVLPIRGYQRFVNPMTPRVVSSSDLLSPGPSPPSASWPLKGPVLTDFQLVRCHPWQAGGLIRCRRGSLASDISPDGHA
jgi:ribonuclease P protein component